ncbi:MAG: SDR family NAD(P)-dependent oxidoreductase [Clostridia bacterium]
MVLDVTDVKNMSSKIEEASKLYKENRIDILVNSAGIGVKTNFYEMSEQEYNQIMDVNVKGTFFMTQNVAKYMEKNNIAGHILNLSSSSALRPAWTPYEMSKWCIKGFTLGAADILSKSNIIVNAIAPGPTVTPMLNKKEGDNISINSNSIKRMAMPNEIASMAVYMCSDMGEMIVGDTFYITGGAGNIINRFD